MPSWRSVALLLVLLFVVAEAYNRHVKVWRHTPKSSDLYWEDGWPLPTDDNEVNRAVSTTWWLWHTLNSTFGLHSHDNAGSIMRTIVKINASEELPGETCPNAFFQNGIAYMCDGMAAADIIGHAWGHGISYPFFGGEFDYANDPRELLTIGAGYSDVVGATALLSLHDQHDYMWDNTALPLRPRWSGLEQNCSVFGGNDRGYIHGSAGEDVSARWLIGASTSFGPMRDMHDPHCFGAPKATCDPFLYDGPDGMQAAKLNNGIINHLFARLVDGGQFLIDTTPCVPGATEPSPSCGVPLAVAPIGLSKAFVLFMETLKQRVNAHVSFSTWVEDMTSVCQTLIGQSVPELRTGDPTSPVWTSDDCTGVDAVLQTMLCRPHPWATTVSTVNLDIRLLNKTGVDAVTLSDQLQHDIAHAIGITPPRISVYDISSSVGGADVIVTLRFYARTPTVREMPFRTAEETSARFKTLFSDPSSALFSGPVSQYIDPTYAPWTNPANPPSDRPGGLPLGWAIFIAIVVTATFVATMVVVYRVKLRRRRSSDGGDPHLPTSGDYQPL